MLYLEILLLITFHQVFQEVFGDCYCSFRFNNTSDSFKLDLFRRKFANSFYGGTFFVPVSVGIIKYSDLLIEQINILLVPNIVSTCVTLLVIGFLGHYLYQMQSFTHKRKKK